MPAADAANALCATTWEPVFESCASSSDGKSRVVTGVWLHSVITILLKVGLPPGSVLHQQAWEYTSEEDECFDHFVLATLLL